jgi:hypothetical protein
MKWLCWKGYLKPWPLRYPTCANASTLPCSSVTTAISTSSITASTIARVAETSQIIRGTVKNFLETIVPEKMGRVFIEVDFKIVIKVEVAIFQVFFFFLFLFGFQPVELCFYGRVFCGFL